MAAPIADRDAVSKKHDTKPKRDDETVKIERGLIEQARIVSWRRKIALAEYLSDLIRGPVGKDYSKTVRDMAVGMKDQ